MIVYRLERDGIGPYRHKNPEFKSLHDELCFAHDRNPHRLSWAEETKLEHARFRTHLSGCDSLDSLKDWFGEFWDRLLCIGFEVKTYTVDIYILAGNQLAFEPEN